MDWKSIYQSRLISADQAVKNIKSGNRVVLQHAAGEPLTLVDAMVRNKDAYKEVEIVHLVALGKGEYTMPEMCGNFTHNALFVGASTRKSVNDARADFTPCFFSEVPKMFKENYLPVDVALIHVTPPDAHGFCSLGVSVDYTKGAAQCAKVVIAQVNEKMPRTFGESLIHVSEIDYIVEALEEILQINPPKITEIERAIGENCAKLVEDGSTLQLGIGAIPDAVLMFLKEKKRFRNTFRNDIRWGT